MNPENIFQTGHHGIIVGPVQLNVEPVLLRVDLNLAKLMEGVADVHPQAVNK